MKILLNGPIFSVRRSFSTFISLLIAMGIYFYFDKTVWLPISTLIACQLFSPSNIVRDVIIYTLIMLLAIFSAVYVRLYLNITDISVVFVLTFLIFSLIFFGRGHTFEDFMHLMLFPFVCMLALFVRSDMASMQYIFLSVLVGALIAVIINQIILGRSIHALFQSGLLTLFSDLQNYSKLFNESFTNKHTLAALFKLQYQIMQDLQNFNYPNWVYEVGFNPGLRSGYRFFLITVEKISDLFFVSANKISLITLNLPINLVDALHEVNEKNNLLIQFLIDYLTTHTLPDTKADFTGDVRHLENILQEIFPHNLEKLELQPEFIPLVGFIRDIKDIRRLLLELIMACDYRGAI